MSGQTGVSGVIWHLPSGGQPARRGSHVGGAHTAAAWGMGAPAWGRGSSGQVHVWQRRPAPGTGRATQQPTLGFPTAAAGMAHCPTTGSTPAASRCCLEHTVLPDNVSAAINGTAQNTRQNLKSAPPPHSRSVQWIEEQHQVLHWKRRMSERMSASCGWVAVHPGQFAARWGAR